MELRYTLKEGEPLAFAFLPRDQTGDIDWVVALDEGIINPKESIIEEEPVPLTEITPILDFKIRFRIDAELPDVIFPHKPHQQLLDCRNCHPAIFLMQAGTNPITMKKIEEGQFCGRCHGKVAFPLTNCDRCHSGPKPRVRVVE